MANYPGPGQGQGLGPLQGHATSPHHPGPPIGPQHTGPPTGPQHPGPPTGPQHPGPPTGPQHPGPSTGPHHPGPPTGPPHSGPPPQPQFHFSAPVPHFLQQHWPVSGYIPYMQAPHFITPPPAVPEPQFMAHAGQRLPFGSASDPVLQEAAAKAAKNGITMEPPPAVCASGTVLDRGQGVATQGSRISDLSPKSMVRGLFSEHLRFVPSPTLPTGQTSSGTIDVSPFGRVKKPLTITLPMERQPEMKPAGPQVTEIKEANSTSSLNPDVQEFKPSPSRTGAGDGIPICKETAGGVTPDSQTFTDSKHSIKPDGTGDSSTDESTNPAPKRLCTVLTKPQSLLTSDREKAVFHNSGGTQDRGSTKVGSLKDHETQTDSAGRHKSSQTEGSLWTEAVPRSPSKDKRKGVRHDTDQSCSSCTWRDQKIRDLQREVCHLRAQMCLNELHRQRFHLDLDIFWWRANFRPVVSKHGGESIMDMTVQRIHQLDSRIARLNAHLHQCLDTLDSGKELAELPAFAVTLSTDEVIMPVSVMKQSTPFRQSTVSMTTPDVSNRKKLKLENSDRSIRLTKSDTSLTSVRRDLSRNHFTATTTVKTDGEKPGEEEKSSVGAEKGNTISSSPFKPVSTSTSDKDVGSDVDTPLCVAVLDGEVESASTEFCSLSPASSVPETNGLPSLSAFAQDAASCGLSSEVELVARAADPAKPTEDVGSSSDQFVIEVSLESPLNQLLSTAVASQHRSEPNRDQSESNSCSEHLSDTVENLSDLADQTLKSKTNDSLSVDAEASKEDKATGSQDDSVTFASDCVDISVEDDVRKEPVADSIDVTVKDSVSKEPVTDGVDTSFKDDVSSELLGDGVDMNFKDVSKDSVDVNVKDSVSKEPVTDGVSVKDSVSKVTVADGVDVNVKDSVSKEPVADSVYAGVEDSVSKVTVADGGHLNVNDSVSKEPVAVSDVHWDSVGVNVKDSVSKEPVADGVDTHVRDASKDSGDLNVKDSVSKEPVADSVDTNVKDDVRMDSFDLNMKNEHVSQEEQVDQWSGGDDSDREAAVSDEADSERASPLDTDKVDDVWVDLQESSNGAQWRTDSQTECAVDDLQPTTGHDDLLSKSDSNSKPPSVQSSSSSPSLDTHPHLAPPPSQTSMAENREPSRAEAPETPPVTIRAAEASYEVTPEFVLASATSVQHDGEGKSMKDVVCTEDGQGSTDGESGVNISDIYQQVVTKLKEDYPMESVDLAWLQKTATEQTQLLVAALGLQQPLEYAPLPSSPATQPPIHHHQETAEPLPPQGQQTFLQHLQQQVDNKRKSLVQAQETLQECLRRISSTNQDAAALELRASNLLPEEKRRLEELPRTLQTSLTEQEELKETVAQHQFDLARLEQRLTFVRRETTTVSTLPISSQTSQAPSSMQPHGTASQSCALSSSQMSSLSVSVLGSCSSAETPAQSSPPGFAPPSVWPMGISSVVIPTVTGIELCPRTSAVASLSSHKTGAFSTVPSSSTLPVSMSSSSVCQGITTELKQDAGIFPHAATTTTTPTIVTNTSPTAMTNTTPTIVTNTSPTAMTTSTTADSHGSSPVFSFTASAPTRTSPSFRSSDDRTVKNMQKLNEKRRTKQHSATSGASGPTVTTPDHLPVDASDGTHPFQPLLPIQPLEVSSNRFSAVTRTDVSDDEKQAHGDRDLASDFDPESQAGGKRRLSESYLGPLVRREAGGGGAEGRPTKRMSEDWDAEIEQDPHRPFTLYSQEDDWQVSTSRRRHSSEKQRNRQRQNLRTPSPTMPSLPVGMSAASNGKRSGRGQMQRSSSQELTSNPAPLSAAPQFVSVKVPPPPLAPLKSAPLPSNMFDPVPVVSSQFIASGGRAPTRGVGLPGGSHPGGHLSTQSVPSTATASQAGSSLPRQAQPGSTTEDWEGESTPFPAPRSINLEQPSQFYISGAPPGFSINRPKYPPGFQLQKCPCPSPSPSASSGSCIPQLDEFSFSKKLDPQAGKIAARTHRPDTKFLEHLLRGNDATNNTLSQRSEKRPAVGEATDSDEKLEQDSAGKTQTSEPEEWQVVGKKGKAEPPKGKVAAAASAKTEKKMTCHQKLVSAIQSSFPNLSRDDVNKVIEKVRREYGGHFHGKMFSEILRDAKNVIYRQFSDTLRSKPQSKPVFTDMSSNKNKLSQLLEKTLNGAWGHPSGAADSVFDGKTEDECSVCLEGIAKTSGKRLDCGHLFHAKCINKWVLEHERTCPNCRMLALMPEEFPRLGS